MNERYRIQAFAAVTGVTVKALLHYDRLGLLRPPRTASGHRIYTGRDRERLEQIVALKFLGIPLRQIRNVLEGQTLPLCQALRAQREALTADRDRIDRAIQAIRLVEAAVADGRGSDAALLRELTSSILQRDAEAVRHHFTDAAWAVCRHHFEDPLPPAWRAFYADVSAALHEDPSSDRAEALLWRMYGIINEETAFDRRLQHDIREGMWRAFRDRDRWPPALQQRFFAPHLRDIRTFIQRVQQMAFLKHGPDFYQQYQHSARFVA